MSGILEWPVTAEDTRQQAKAKHLMRDIIAIVFFAGLANASGWIEVCLFAAAHEEALRKYLELPHGIPSHDTIQRVPAVVSPECLQEFRRRWNETMPGDIGEKIKRILALDGETRRGNGNGWQKANHTVSSVGNGGFCIGEVLADDKSNEITAIPELSKRLNVQGTTATADAMGCQTDIARLISKGKGDYMPGLAIRALCMRTLGCISMILSYVRAARTTKQWTRLMAR